MSWPKVILLVFVGFTQYAFGSRPNRERGALIGQIRTLQHNVSGTVWAVDEDMLFIEDFTYDGLGPDAFFWIGDDIQPSPRGKLIRYPLTNTDEKPAVLPRMDREDIILHLPHGTKITEMKWLSIWCRRFTVDFGHVYINSDLDPPRQRTLPEFQRLAHGLRSGNITILDAKTFYIPNLHYDGRGPDAYFWVGKGPKPDPKGHKIPNEMGSLDVLRAYEGEDIELQLPDNLTVYDIDYLGVWCVTYKHNFGHVQIPRADELWVPPALGQTRIKPADSNEADGSGHEREENVYHITDSDSSSSSGGRRPQEPVVPGGTTTHTQMEEKEIEEAATDHTGSQTDTGSSGSSDSQDLFSGGQGSNSTGGGASSSFLSPSCKVIMLFLPFFLPLFSAGSASLLHFLLGREDNNNNFLLL